jgi:hypothetical protein
MRRIHVYAVISAVTFTKVAQSSPINSASSRSSSSVISPAFASPLGSGNGAMTAAFIPPAGFSGVEAASSEDVQFHKLRCSTRSHSPLKRHLRTVPSRLVETIHGSILVCPVLFLLDRIQSLRAVTSCQCASISPRISGSDGVETSYNRITSPKAVTT